MVRSHLKHVLCFGSRYQKDMELPECVQRRPVKLVKELENELWGTAERTGAG